eukprot:COSAG01_NODE_272_length_19747_cov_298.524023_16_plen_93_part_00
MQDFDEFQEELAEFDAALVIQEQVRQWMMTRRAAEVVRERVSVVQKQYGRGGGGAVAGGGEAPSPQPLLRQEEPHAEGAGVVDMVVADGEHA